MKKILILLISVFVLGAYNVYATNSEKASSSETENPQVCKFSLDSYTGTILDTYPPSTSFFKVILSCPQEEDVTATVDLYIEGELIASMVVDITKGEKESGNCSFKVSKEYVGKKYTLRVE